MQTPLFSVVIPTYQRLQKLAQCLGSLVHQTCAPDDYEVIVVDDAAMRDDVARITATVALRRCRLLSQERLGAASARNAGARAARGRLLAFTDDDCQPAPDWLERLAQRLSAEGDTALLGGRVVNTLTTDPFASASQALVDFLCEQFNQHESQAPLLTSNNLCVPSVAFRDIGGFDTTFAGAGGEDREFCLRWARAGLRSHYAPEAVVHHAHDMTLSGFLRQHYAYGRGAAWLRQRALVHGYGPVSLERASFYWQLLRYPLRACAPGARVQQSTLFVLSQVANAAGYFHVRMRGPRVSGAMAPLPATPARAPIDLPDATAPPETPPRI